jgi:N-acetylglucosaminyl-diphospho-decaprenol L-rhamnosyltransferase
MRIFISVVSHHDHATIINMGSIKRLAQYSNIEVICRDNVPSPVLQQACLDYHCHYIANMTQQGFAQNNNDNFLHAKKELGMINSDYFMLLNPDVAIDELNIEKLLQALKIPKKFASMPMFLDIEQRIYDDHLRYYPKLTDFIKSYLYNDRKTMLNVNEMLTPKEPIWVSGALMIVNAQLFEKMGMLHNKYFMYCEDIDFCQQLKNIGIAPIILNDISAIHCRQRKSKTLFSRYFCWHFHSVLRYQLRRLLKRI